MTSWACIEEAKNALLRCDLEEKRKNTTGQAEDEMGRYSIKNVEAALLSISEPNRKILAMDSDNQTTNCEDG